LGLIGGQTEFNDLLIKCLFFGRKLAFIQENRATMKTLINLIKAVFEPSTFSQEKMPALIPVRVVTKIHPNQYR